MTVPKKKRYRKTCCYKQLISALDCISSYAWVILVVYFLQHTTPPVLPFLQQSRRPADAKNFIIHGADCYFDNQIAHFKTARNQAFNRYALY